MAQHETNDCITFAGFMQILGPRYGIYWTHIPNGGFRHPRTAAVLKKMGVRRGVWDFYFRKLGLPTLWMEFKHGKNRLTDEQATWGNALRPMGDVCDIVYGPLEGLASLTRNRFLPLGAYFPFGSTIRIPARISDL